MTTKLPDEGVVRLVIMWPDSSIDCGSNATEILKELCGGWNPDTLPELREELARRAGITAPSTTEDDRDFLDRLERRGILRIYEVYPDEWPVDR